MDRKTVSTVSGEVSEGMPLALELAATWIRVLSLPEIVAEIQRNQAILATTMHDVPLDFDTLQPLGTFIGSAAVVVLSDQDRVQCFPSRFRCHPKDEGYTCPQSFTPHRYQ